MLWMEGIKQKKKMLPLASERSRADGLIEEIDVYSTTLRGEGGGNKRSIRER